MQTDGQLYNLNAPPARPPEVKHEEDKKHFSINTDELLLLGLLYLLMSDKKCRDMPLIMALVYILLF